MSKEFNARIKWKKDTQSNWESKNPILLNGEIIIVEMTSGEKRFKIGDGTSPYNSLSFQDVTASQVSYTPMPSGNITETNIQDALEQVDTYTTDMLSTIISHTENKSNPHGVTTAQIGAVPTTRTINNKSLGSNITLTAGDVGADAAGTASGVQSNLTNHINNKSNPHEVTAVQVGAVPTSRTVNNKPLSSNITLTAGDVGADAAGAANTVQSNLTSHINNKSNPHGVTAAQAGAVPTSRTVNGKALSSNISLSASDVGALPISGGTLTGNLTGKYLTGTWLQSTAVTNMNSANYRGICVFDDSGWVYLRTKAEILSDIGASSGGEGTKIVVQSGQPSGLKTGDLWYKIV